VEVMKQGRNNSQSTDKNEIQPNMTEECWIIQMHGAQACEPCPSKDKDECTGQRIRKTGKNSKGIKVPV